MYNNEELAKKVAALLGKSLNEIYYNMPMEEIIAELVKVIENEPKR